MAKGITISFEVPDTTVARQYVDQLKSMATQTRNSNSIQVQAHSQSDYQSLQQESQSQSWKEANVTLLPFSSTPTN